MTRWPREITYSLVAIVLTTALYAAAYVQQGAMPAAYGLIGHGIGVLGFVLMLMAETLYSIRKQLTDAHWGNMASWLRFHIVTGLVGPYMVLLHTSMKFQGLAGVAMLLTVVVVASGIVGRYLYTSVPRLADGRGAAGGLDLGSPGPRFQSMTALGLRLVPVLASDGMGASSEQLRDAALAEAAAEERSRRLAARRQALATWRAMHVPITWLLFATAAVHVVAALYYATLQR